jgi:signal transduction histidine kinase
LRLRGARFAFATDTVEEMSANGWRLQAGTVAALAIAAFTGWTLTGGDFWPRWVWFGLALMITVRLALARALRAPAGRSRRFAVHAAVTAVLIPTEVIVWALSGRGLFWPLGPILVLAAVLAAHAWVLGGPPGRRERELTGRIERLTRTRRGALDAQAQELRRIERDLHDGTQARLVSLAITISLAESLLRSDPDAASVLLAEARAGTTTALTDLRAVMQSVHPPVLADRGLLAAVQALALDLAVPVTVDGEIIGVVPPAIESAVYFAVAECLANVVKHAQADRAAVHLSHVDQRLVATVSDDGVGGAGFDAGSGLPGIARRLEAFDGRMSITSPPGGPTSIIVEVPCELSSPKI